MAEVDPFEARTRYFVSGNAERGFMVMFEDVHPVTPVTIYERVERATEEAIRLNRATHGKDRTDG
jgi:hypothetical protein